MHASNEAIDKYAFFIVICILPFFAWNHANDRFLSNNELTLLPIVKISIKILHIHQLLKKERPFLVTLYRFFTLF